MKPQAQFFYNSYSPHFQINKRFFELVEEKDYSTMLAPNTNSVKMNLQHQIGVMRNYIEGVEQGKLEFNAEKYLDLDLEKDELLKKLNEEFSKLKQVLEYEDIDSRMTEAPWGEVTSLSTLWALKDHEILHTGINIAFMDILKMERFPELIKMWGK